MTQEMETEINYGVKKDAEDEWKGGFHEKIKNQMESEVKGKNSSEMKLEMDAISENESLARVCAVTFLTRLHPTLEEMEDVKTAVSEAVTNAIIHGLPEDGKVYITCASEENIFRVEIEDHGVGIENVEKAMEPLFTTKPGEERSGMGFAFMEAFMDQLLVESAPGKGTKIIMEKAIGFSRYEE